MKRFITAALPYANGPIHIGHMVEYIQADIYTRFLRSVGEDVLFICADDAHGTPIEINAAKQGIAPEQLVARFAKEHKADFDAFNIAFDNYYTTNSPENKALSDSIFLTLKEKGHIYRKDVELTYCTVDARFLPDRYVKGQCPRCGASDQYGDVCEKCNAAYKTTELVNPYCVLCKTPPTRKTSSHYFFRLSAFSDKLKAWLTNHPAIQGEVKNFILEWIHRGLEDWDISRDGPYFGFKIPGEENMYYYVWLDAPIGYFASLTNYCTARGIDAKQYLKGDGRFGHFIGKDIMYFHLLFWPAMLMGAGYNLPDRIHVHGFLTVGGEKMSKSRGTFLTAREFLGISDPEFLRFHFASNLSNKLSDIDLDWQDYFDKINNELVSKVANFCYRTLSFCTEQLAGEVLAFVDEDLEAEARKLLARIEAEYRAVNLREAVAGVLELASLGNRFFQEKQPWKAIKEDKTAAHKTVSSAVRIAEYLTVALAPVTPHFSAQLAAQLQMKNTSWKMIDAPLTARRLGTPEIVLRKIEELPGKPKKNEPFSALHIKVGKVLSVEDHPSADKLYVLKVDTGEERQIVAGLRPYIEKGELLGKHILVLCNLKPAKLRGVESQGMLLAADDGKKVAPVQAPHARPGDEVSAGDVKTAKPAAQISFDEFKKVTLSVKDKKALCEGKALRTETGDVIADADDGASIR